MFLSEDKGVTWAGPIPAFGGDKNWMAVDTSGGIGDRNIYPIWNSQFTCCGFGTDYTRSLDDGASYQGPFATPQKPKWGTVAVGPDGELYYVGARTNDTSQHLVLKSTSARDPFENPVFEQVTTIDLGGETSTNGIPNPGGLMGQVWVAVDQSDGPTRGYVYVLGSVDPPGPDPMDVNIVISTDGGATFSTPERVNHDPSEPTSWQWFGTMSVAPNGRLDVVWNDTSQTDSALESALYYAYSTRTGLKFSDALQVGPVFNSVIGHPNQNKIGDYYDMKSDNTGAGVAYAATYNGEQDVFYLRVGDCDNNGLHDSEDIIADGTVDCNRNGVLDACEGFECPPCDLDVECTDELFCNGVETCESNQCRPGAPADCSDGDLCTQDLCDVGTDQCVNPPVLAPAPTDDVLVGKEAPGSDVAVFDWNAVAGADEYNMYRGVQQDLGDLSCLIPGIAGTSSPDDGLLPLPGEAFYYAISAENCAGESTLGTDSEGNDRVGFAPCF
jgi:hypothetical protein